MTAVATTHKGRCIRTGLCVALVLATGHAAAEDRNSIAIGMQASRGDYGSKIDTTIVSVPVSVQLRRGGWQLEASLPWLRVSGDRTVLPTYGPVPLMGPLPGGTGRTGRNTTTGVGDLELAAKYSVDTGGAVGIDIGVAAKLATADEARGLGTGTNDYAIGLDVHRAVGDTLLFAGAELAWLGGSSRITADTQQRVTVGLGRRAGPGHLGVAYAHRSALADHVDARRDAAVFYDAATGNGRKVRVHASRGLSDGSPDWGIGVSVGTAF